jgi:serine-type D-Ala-D-Ala carboxypeptidase (penicillin-binding protein 5/6)
MGMSPFLPPDKRGQQRGRARWRNWRVEASAGVVIAIVAAAAAIVLIHARDAHGSGRASHRPHHYRPAPVSVHPVHLSSVGLPLGPPAFTLHGVGSPAHDVVQASFAEPPRAGLLFNLKSGRVLWQLNPYARLRIASLTKMMTALLTVKSAPPRAHVLVTKAAENMPGSRVGVLPLGKDVELETMLYGLLLPSGNDAAVALAQHVAGTVSKFVWRMNVQAAKLGMGCTRYSSPSGYYNEGNFSCAADLAMLAHVDLQQPRIASIVHTYTAALPFPIQGGRLDLENNNPLLIYHYPGTTGMKTGYTEEAGKCLVATAERDGVRLGVVLLHSPEPGTQAAYLLNRGFYGIYHLPPIPEPPIPGGV